MHKKSKIWRNMEACFMKKKTTKQQKIHLSKVASLGCIVCANNGIQDSLAEIHHPRTGVGMGQRSPHSSAIPLCPAHHRTGGPGVAIHAGQKTWEAIHGTETELLAQVRELLGVKC